MSKLSYKRINAVIASSIAAAAVISGIFIAKSFGDTVSEHSADQGSSRISASSDADITEKNDIVRRYEFSDYEWTIYDYDTSGNLKKLISGDAYTINKYRFFSYDIEDGILYGYDIGLNFRGTKFKNIITPVVYRYDDDNKLLQEYDFYLDPDYFQELQYSSYEYDSDDNIQESTSINIQTNIDYKQTPFKYEYENGLLVSKSQPQLTGNADFGYEDRKWTYEYDNEGRCIRQYVYSAGHNEPDRRFEYTYDSDGYLTEQSVSDYGEFGFTSVDHHLRFRYDPNGKLTDVTRYPGISEQPNYSFDLEYDRSGNLIRASQVNAEMSSGMPNEYIYEYSDTGDIISSSEHFNESGYYRSCTYKYNDSGMLIESTPYYNGEAAAYAHKYEYDENGLISKLTDYNLDGTENTDYTAIYSYYTNGLIRQIYVYDRTFMTFDPDGGAYVIR